MYKKILCALDVSAESETILEKAASIAQLHNGQLSIAHVIEYAFLPKDYQKQLKEDIAPRFNKMGEQYGIPKKRRVIKFGQPYSVVCDLQKKLDADLIVVGTHGKHGLKALLGSTANGVLQKAECDVLLVKVG